MNDSIVIYRQKEEEAMRWVNFQRIAGFAFVSAGILNLIFEVYMFAGETDSRVDVIIGDFHGYVFFEWSNSGIGFFGIATSIIIMLMGMRALLTARIIANALGRF